ncbi:MAG: succinate dehydrogenase, cytochrome b556 subunit [Alphaproteobacteria bacterium]|nr:succinate dehydrogenase, cytochrome b556 subunit [Alphaproteobacteria bacterium]
MTDTSQTKVPRPLSPHLSIYNLPLTALMSITHRMTGAVLALGTLLWAAFLISAASGEEYYKMVMYAASSHMGRIILLLWSAALYFHMCNGIRHMIWDTGKFLEKDKAMRTNYVVILVAVIMTAVTWVCAYLK